MYSQNRRLSRGSNSKRDDFDGVASVIDGRTGLEYSVEEFRAIASADTERRMAGRFIKGPLPIATIAAASEKSPAALQATLVLFFLHGMTGRRRFKAEPARFDELGISRKSRQRGLQALEEIGLITIDRRNGCSLEVVLLDDFFGPKFSG
jgi:hypothetical protein